MARLSKENHILFLLIVGLLGWFLPGAGHFLLKEQKRALIIFATITLTFCTGLYVGSIGVIDPVGAKPWYVAQIMNSPMVAVLGHLTAGGGFPVYGRPNDIGQIYTGIAGLLNLLCIINAVYLAHLNGIEPAGE
jgi:hypothetical protein